MDIWNDINIGITAIIFDTIGYSYLDQNDG